MLAKTQTAAVSPDEYAGDAIVGLYVGTQPDPPLTPAVEMALLKNGFIARRRDDRGSPYLVLTAKGENLAEDIGCEREWKATRDVIRVWRA